MKDFFARLMGQRGLLAAVLLLGAAAKIASLFDIVIFKILIDRYAQAGQITSINSFFWLIAPYLLLLTAIIILGKISISLQDYYANLLIEKTSHDLQNQALSKALACSYEKSLQEPSAKIIQNILAARNSWQDFLRNLIYSTYAGVIGIVFVMAFCFTLSPLIGALFSLLALMMIIAAYGISRHSADLQQQIHDASADLSVKAADNIKNLELLQSLGLTANAASSLAADNGQILNLRAEKFRRARKYSLILSGIIAGARLTVIFGALYFVFQGSLSLGGYLSLFVYTSIIFSPLDGWYRTMLRGQEMRAAFKSLPPETIPAAKPNGGQEIKLAKIETIAICGLGYAYSGGGFALSDINLQIKAGETIALTGPSGSGKSTIIKLLLGLLTPQSGAININGYELKDLGHNLREKIALVSQQAYFFTDSIKHNLTLHDEKIDDAACYQALEAVGLRSWLELLPSGLDTAIGEGGVRLSGGERQRLALAAALLRRPQLIILDEPTNHLDPLLRQQLVEVLTKIRATRADLMTIIISHEYCLTQLADRLYCLENGRIVESGSQQELAARAGTYARMFLR